MTPERKKQVKSSLPGGQKQSYLKIKKGSTL